MLEESEEEDSVNLSVSMRDGEKGLHVRKGSGQGGESTRRRVMIDGSQIGDESFYIEEIIEESEEESDEDDHLPM